MKNYDMNLIIQEARKELARRNYIDYCEYVHRGYWKPFKVHELICSKLEEVFTGKCKRLIIQMPPRHGKSNTVTETFPSFYMMKYASMGIKKNVIQVSYSSDLAEDFGAKNRDKIDEIGAELFNIGLNQKAKRKWTLESGAMMVSAGVGGPVTGKGASLLIIDDPIKNREEAESETYREKLWNEWTSTLRTRLAKDAAVIVIQTRWHEDDLAGRLIAQGGWEVISFPAVCEDEDDLLGRKIGDPLCPELGFDKEWAELTKREVGSRTWESLYQQRPTAAEGNTFKRNWFRFYDPRTFEIEKLESVTLSIDAAFKDDKDKDNDFVAIGVWGNKGPDHYLLYVIKERMDFVKTIQAIIGVTKRYPQAVLKLIEDKANGPAIISTLRKKIHGIVAVNPGKDSKLSRAMAVTALFEAGNIHVPDPLYAPWVEDYIEELVSFPNGKHDDQVDMTTQYLKRYINPSQLVQIDTNMFGNDEDDWLFY